MSQTKVPHEGMAKPLSLGNRRAVIRYRCAPATIGKIITHSDQEMERAWIVDLSLRGVGMQISRSLPLGEHVVITMRSSDSGKLYELSGVVVQCHALHHGEWHIGCELNLPLTPEDLEHLL